MAQPVEHEYRFLTIVPDQNYSQLDVDPTLIGQKLPKRYDSGDPDYEPFEGQAGVLGEFWILDGVDHKHLLNNAEGTGNFDPNHADAWHGHAATWNEATGNFVQVKWGPGANHSHTIYPYEENGIERLHPAYWMVEYACDQFDYDILTVDNNVKVIAPYEKISSPISSGDIWSEYPSTTTWTEPFRTTIQTQMRNLLGMNIPDQINSGIRFYSYVTKFVVMPTF